MRNLLLHAIFIFFAFGINAQTKHIYNFEGNKENWITNDSILWDQSSEHALSGNFSLAYNVPDKARSPNSAIISIDTERHTIMKVRSAKKGEDEMIVGSDYDGILLGVGYDGAILWKSKTGNGTMNHDVWCADLNNDGIDEILAANANGHLYCFDIDGKKLWEFEPYLSDHLTPMYAVCVVKDSNGIPYVVCGDFTANLYYISAKGKLVKTINSSKYSKVKGWGDDKPADYKSNANFLRPIPLSDGSDLLLVSTTNNHMQSDGEIHVMKPLSETSQCYIADPKSGKTMGDLRIFDNDGDGVYEVVYGSSTLNAHTICKLTFNSDYSSGKVIKHVISNKNAGTTSYRVNQPFLIPGNKENYYSFLSSNIILTYKVDSVFTLSERLSGSYTYNDIWQGENNRILLASSQDGGSCIHVIDTNDSDWKKEFEDLEPIGKISKIKSNARLIRAYLSNFEKPIWQREPIKVIGFEGQSLPIASSLNGSKSLQLFGNPWSRGKVQEPSWRSPLFDGNIFKDKRDSRHDYILTAQQVISNFTSEFDGVAGITTWGGHGNDPLFYSLDVLKQIADYGYEHGKKQTIYIYPEMNHHGTEFDFVMENHIYPLMRHQDSINGKVALRSKNIYWQGPIYTESFKEIIAGNYADVVIPVMEETTDKTQDLSLLGRMGLWASGSVNGWGVRCSRDDPSFDRSRQFSSQKLSNHVLRKVIYSVACGARYLHNSYADTENDKFENHTSLALELIAKEALYVPKRNEILSFSPVHLSIVSPQEKYLKEGESSKWTTYFNRTEEEENPMVFSHMNGTWLGAALTPWDFSTYASGVVDRRQNAIPPYPFGKVLITPVQNGVFADTSAVRGKLVDNLHPLYKNIMKEYITDGVDYISADGTQRFRADSFYLQIKKDIEEAAKKLPVLVSGDKVAWVVAQMSPTHLRLTLVDGGYLNPNDRKVKVQFNNIAPVRVQDVLDKKTFEVLHSTSEIDVPCGMFRFIDIELNEPLKIN